MYPNGFSNFSAGKTFLPFSVWAVGFSILLLLVAFSFGQTTQIPEVDLIHRGDLIDVDVAGSYEYDWRGTLTPEGFLDGLNPFGDPIYGLCKSGDAIAIETSKAFSKTLRDPKVAVRIIDRSNRAVVVLTGAVRSPQRFQIKRPVHLRELIILSGGITDGAGGEIQILRSKTLGCSETALKDNRDLIMNIKISDLVNGKVESDPDIRSGDLVTVQSAIPIYVIGGVTNPRTVAARGKTSLSRAVAMAGGTTKDAVPERVTIFRRNNRETKIIEADLGKIAAGKADDPILQALDIVEVSQKGREKRKYPPIVTAKRPGGLETLPLRVID